MSHEGKDMCHECKYMSIADRRAIVDLNTSDSEISCSFYNFRKLIVNKSKTKIEVAGYLGQLISKSPFGVCIQISQKSAKFL